MNERQSAGGWVSVGGQCGGGEGTGGRRARGSRLPAGATSRHAAQVMAASKAIGRRRWHECLQAAAAAPPPQPD